MGDLYGKHFHALTGKQRGQLKQLKKYLGVVFGPVLDYTLHHWIDFANDVESETKCGKSLTPDLDILLVGYHIALNRYEQLCKRWHRSGTE